MRQVTRTLIVIAVSAALVVLATACDDSTSASSSCSVVQQDDGSVRIHCPDGSNAVVEPARATVFDQPVGNDGPMACTAIEEMDGSLTITCPDGSEFSVADGEDGNSCGIVVEDERTFLRCDDGTEAVLPQFDDIEVRDGLDGQDGAPGLDGQDGQDGQDGRDGQDGSSCTIVQENGQTILRCEDGTETVLPSVGEDPGPIDDPTGGTIEEQLQDDLTAEEIEEIDILRDAITQGLNVGDQEYVDKVTLSLQTAGVLSDYEASIEEGWSNTQESFSNCPFAEYYGNTGGGTNCDFLVELAKLDAYADLSTALDRAPLPQVITQGQFAEQATFWYEQGAVSGIEQRRVMVRADLRRQEVCSTNPTPNEGAYDKGYTVGSQLMADSFNDWLASQGHTPDYPAMSNPIQVCNMNQSALDPAYQNAVGNVGNILLTTPLCLDYVPPTQQHALEFSQASMQYEAGVRAGVEAERALAAVRIFRVIPCNVSDPIVVDLDGDGLELLPVHRGVNFDFYAVGTEQAVAWVAPDDGLLVLDRDADGAITSGAELFGNIDQSYSDGFAQLATLDADGDGALTAADPAWSKLGVWRDANSDGETQPGELLDMAQAGLVSIPVTGAPVSMRSEGTRIPAAALAQGTAGDVLIGDALFQTAPYASPSF